MNATMDMRAVIVPKSDQINADDLISGPMNITIREVRIKRGDEQPVDILFDGSDKFYRPCKSMSRALTEVWGFDAGKYIGKSLTLYRDPKVRFGKDQVGGIRISHMTDIPGEMIDSNGRVILQLTVTRSQRKPHVIKPLVIEPEQDRAADWTRDHIAGVEDAETLTDLEAVIAGGEKAVARLEKSRPELHTSVMQAYDARRGELSREGKSSEDMGEDFSDDGEEF